VPSRRVTPRPRTRKVRPLAVPAGTRSVTTRPSSVGTWISAPRAASAKVTGTVTVRLSPLRPKTGCGWTCTVTLRSPAGPPRSPGAPLPASRIRCPSATPAGIRTFIVRVEGARPLPWHTGHGSSTTRPRPRQVRQGSENANAPWARLVVPVPPQVGHTWGDVPARAPVPWQAAHGACVVMRIGTVTPWTASVKRSVTSLSTSAPRRGACVRVRPAPPNRPPNRSPRPPPAPPAPPNRSPRSKPTPPVPRPPRGPPPGVVNRNCPEPNSSRASSYSLRLDGSDRTPYASPISLNRSSAAGSPLFWSGWYRRASLR
jgi:hypothetical protein